MPVKVLVLWAPYLKGDSQAAAEKATRFLTDGRAHHFWDLWRFGTRVYSEQFRCRPQDAWDIYVLYEAKSAWQEAAPPASSWMHNRKIEQGAKYSPEAVEAQLLEWTR